tara:strand:+ start:107 stop:232 length:126 start_codon:yes stop_codon:yes gene_type:complete
MTVREILRLFLKKHPLVMEEEKVDLINGKEKRNIEDKADNG